MTEIKTDRKTVDPHDKTGMATEYSYGGFLQSLVQQLIPDFTVTNETARINCGALDYIIARRHEILLGLIKAKVNGASLDHKTYK